MAKSDKSAAVDRIVETAIYLQAEGRRLAKEKCASRGITATQLSVLKLLSEIGDLSLSELSRALAANNSTITGIVDRMADADLVERQRSESDRRVWKIVLTKKGESIATELDVAPWDLLRGALSSLPKSDLASLIRTLDAVATHINDAVASHASDGNAPRKKRRQGGRGAR